MWPSTHSGVMMPRSIRTVRLVANGSAAEPVRVPLPPTLDALLEVSGSVLHVAAHSLLDDEGKEVTDLQRLRTDERLFVCSRVDEPFLRDRPKRCQLFRVAHADHVVAPPMWGTVPMAQDAAVARWHEGKVVAVPKTMAELRAVAAERLGLHEEVGSIRLRSAGSGLLIFETAAVKDDDLLLVETPTPATAADDVRSMLLRSPITSTRLVGEALDAVSGVRAHSPLRSAFTTTSASEAPLDPAAPAAGTGVATSGRRQERGGRPELRADGDEQRIGTIRLAGRPSVGNEFVLPRKRRHQLRRRRRLSSSSCSTSSLSSSDDEDPYSSSNY